MNKFSYSPGMPGYGTKGSDGSTGLTGLATFFSSYDGLNDTITLKTKILNNKKLNTSNDNIPGYPTRVYQTGDQFIDKYGKVFAIDLSSVDVFSYTNQTLNTTGFFELGLNNITTPIYTRYSNNYNTNKLLIDTVYAATIPSNYAANPASANGIYGIGAIDFGKINYVNHPVGNYEPFEIFTNTANISEPEKSFAIVKEIASNNWHIGNLSNVGLLRNINLSLDFANTTFSGNGTFNDGSNLIMGNFNIFTTSESTGDWILSNDSDGPILEYLDGVIIWKNTTLNGTLNVSGITNINNNLSVGGITRLNSDVSINGKLIVTNTTSLNNDVSINGNLVVTTMSKFNIASFNDVSINGLFYVNNNANFSNDVSINGDLYVNNNFFANNTIFNDVSINGKLYANIINTDVSIKSLKVDGSIYIKESIYANNLIDLSYTQSSNVKKYNTLKVDGSNGKFYNSSYDSPLNLVLAAKILWHNASYSYSYDRVKSVLDVNIIDVSVGVYTILGNQYNTKIRTNTDIFNIYGANQNFYITTSLNYSYGDGFGGVPTDNYLTASIIHGPSSVDSIYVCVRGSGGLNASSFDIFVWV